MSELKVSPVFKCKRCAAPFTVKIATFVSDPNGEMLQNFLQGVAKVGLCPTCDNQRAWYYSQGRSEEWEREVA